MYQLRFLMVPVFTGLAAFTLAIFNSVDAINIESLTVPASAVGNTGITPDFLIKTLVDRMEEIEHQAAELDPSFTSPLLNAGVVLVRQGKREEAIAKFQQVTKVWRRGGPVDVLAAAYSEWGFALALMGRTQDAEAKFKQAVATDPTFSDVYLAWGEVLAANGRPDEAHAMADKALKLAPVEKVFTDNLVGRIKELPAAAAISG